MNTLQSQNNSSKSGNGKRTGGDNGGEAVGLVTPPAHTIKNDDSSKSADGRKNNKNGNGLQKKTSRKAKDVLEHTQSIEDRNQTNTDEFIGSETQKRIRTYYHQ